MVCKQACSKDLSFTRCEQNLRGKKWLWLRRR